MVRLSSVRHIRIYLFGIWKSLAADRSRVTSPDKQSLNFRSVYVARAGHTLLAADFKHIECRVFAHAAADSGLLSALESPDLFRVLAAKW